MSEENKMCHIGVEMKTQCHKKNSHNYNWSKKNQLWNLVELSEFGTTIY